MNRKRSPALAFLTARTATLDRSYVAFLFLASAVIAGLTIAILSLSRCGASEPALHAVTEEVRQLTPEQNQAISSAMALATAGAFEGRSITLADVLALIEGAEFDPESVTGGPTRPGAVTEASSSEMRQLTPEQSENIRRLGEAAQHVGITFEDQDPVLAAAVEAAQHVGELGVRIEDITLALRQGIPEYDRSEWGRWGRTDETGDNGCRWDVRHLLLVQVGRATDPSTLVTREESGKSCRVVALTVDDWYTGQRHTGPASKIDIDHIVPLAEAHRSGGWAWSRAQRLEFWNDSINHVAVHESVNSSKSDVDPGGESRRGQRRAGWWPPDETEHCSYARMWIRVKTKWRLSYDSKEVAALAEVLEGCTDGGPHGTRTRM
jgi:hypothetical protein